MKTTTKISHAKFWTLLKQVDGYNEEFKEDIKYSYVKHYSNGTTESLSEFAKQKPFEYLRMVRNIEQEVKQHNTRHNKQRRKLLALIYEFSKHGNYFCTTEIAIGIACIACGVQKFNNASEQKVIAAIKSFEAKEADAWVTAIFKKVTDK